MLVAWDIEEYCMYSSDEPIQRSREGYLTLEWPQKQFVTRLYILLYVLHDISNQ